MICCTVTDVHQHQISVFDAYKLFRNIICWIETGPHREIHCFAIEVVHEFFGSCYGKQNDGREQQCQKQSRIYHIG